MRDVPRVVWVLAIGSFINRFGGFVLVFLVLYVRHLGYSVAWAGMAASCYAAGKLAAGPVGGELTDRAGPRACIATSMFGSAAAMLALSQLRWLPGLLALGCLTGLLSELYRPSTSKLIADAVDGGRRITAFGVYQTGVSAGVAAGPAIAGFLAERSYLWLFVGDAATSLLWGTLALVLLPTPSPTPLAPDQPPAAVGDDRDTRAAWTARSARRRTARLLAATLGVNLVLFQSQSTFPLWVTSHGHSPAVYGMLLSASALLAVTLQLPLSTLTRRWHPPRVIAASSVIVGAGFGLVGLGGGVAVLAAATLVWSLGELVQWPVAASYLTDLAPPHHLGRYAGLRSLAYGTAMLIAPSGGTTLYRHDPRLVWWLSVAVGLAAAVTLLPDLTGTRSSSSWP
jgi:MFS family permease